jgi:hypothetical protein
VAGEISVQPTAYAARWSNGVITKFASSSGGGAFAIDDAGGLFGGVVTDPGHVGYPAIWSPTGTLTKMTAQAGLADVLNLRLTSASDNGNVVGASNYATTPTSNPFKWFYAIAPAYAVVSIGTSAELGNATTLAINNAGTIAVGSATTPFLLVNGVRKPLKVSITSNFDLNNNGDVAGTVVPAPASGNSQAAIELANGTVEDLPPLNPGDSSVTVTALNDHDEAVGHEYTSAGAEIAVAWINEKPVAVKSMVAGNFSTALSAAVDVNNNGSILAEVESQAGPSYYLLAAPSASSVTGTITYGYAAGAQDATGIPVEGAVQDTPARDTEVEILDATSSTCTTKVLSSVYTSDTGTYSSASLPSNQKYFCVKILAATKYSEVIPYSSETATKASSGTLATDNSDAYASRVLGPKKLASSGTTTFSWRPDSLYDEIDQALDIDNAVVTGARWLDVYGVTPKFIPILYPYPTSEGVSNFNSSPPVANINKQDAFNWSVLLHEYGHYVGSLLGLDNTIPVKTNQHNLGQNMTNYEADKSQGLAISWNEGFADFFSQMVQRAMNTAALGLTDVGASPPTYIGQYPGGVIEIPLNVPGNTKPDESRGEDNEESVARVLWAIYDQTEFSGASGSAAFVKVLASAMTSNDSRTLSGAVSALLAALHATPWVPDVGSSSTNAPLPAGFDEAASASTYGTILSSQNVAPTITEASVTSDGGSITLGWKTGQPLVDDEALNLFLVQFWNNSWNTLLGEQVVAYKTPPYREKDNSYLFFASQSIPRSWKVKVVKAVVLGWNTATAPAGLTIPNSTVVDLKPQGGQDPLTGPYISAPVTIAIG